jgi:hypothetical protein
MLEKASWMRREIFEEQSKGDSSDLKTAFSSLPSRM